VSGERALKTGEGPESWARVSIVGLGVIGGSMARALRERWPELELTGIDRAEVVAAAAARTLVHECITDVDDVAVRRAFASSDLVFLAAPISGIRRWLEPALAEGALVTDCGSTKRAIAESARALPRSGRFVPGHPMAGAGASRAAARADLFEGRPWVLCPDGVEPQALAAIEHLVALVGARPVHMTAAEHDRAVAFTSHAPRLVASALTTLVERAGAFDVAGPAFERLMRGAGGAPEVWRDVFQSNADEVACALRALLGELQTCADELERSRLERSLDLLAAAERTRLAREADPAPLP
jgi:prephenate dehydrogenase